MDKLYYIYILASITKRLYVGVTNNLIRRVFEHKESVRERLQSNTEHLLKTDPSLNFTTRYNIDKLI